MRIAIDGGEAEPLVDGESPGLSLDGRELFYTEPSGHRVLAMPASGGGAPRVITDAPGRVVFLQPGPDDKVHVTAETQTGLEAWSAPLAGGIATRELPPPWSALRPAPRSGWRALEESLGARAARNERFLTPGMAIDDPGARNLRGVWRGTWMPDGLSWLYWNDDNSVHRFFVATGEDRVIANRRTAPGRGRVTRWADALHHPARRPQLARAHHQLRRASLAVQ